MEIVQYQDKYKVEAIQLILHIQNDESKVNMPLEGQPDLLDIPAYYIKRGGDFWVATDDNHVIGTIALMKINDDWCVMKKFFVRSDYRSQKVGFALYSRLLDFANAKEFKHMVLDTPSVAKKAHLFYERAGFRRISKSDLAIEYDYLDRDSIIFQLDL